MVVAVRAFTRAVLSIICLVSLLLHITLLCAAAKNNGKQGVRLPWGQGTGREALCVQEKPDSSSCSSLSVTQAASAGGSGLLWMLTGYRNKQALLMPLASLDFLALLCIFSLRTLCPQGWRGPAVSHTSPNV